MRKKFQGVQFILIFMIDRFVYSVIILFKAKEDLKYKELKAIPKTKVF